MVYVHCWSGGHGALGDEWRFGCTVSVCLGTEFRTVPPGKILTLCKCIEHLEIELRNSGRLSTEMTPSKRKQGPFALPIRRPHRRQEAPSPSLRWGGGSDRSDFPLPLRREGRPELASSQGADITHSFGEKRSPQLCLCTEGRGLLLVPAFPNPPLVFFVEWHRHSAPSFPSPYHQSP